MSASRGRLSREDVIGKVPRVSMGLDKSPHAITSSHGSDSNRRSLSIANIATSAFFKRGADGLWIPKYQNSYRLEPYNRFKPEVTDKIIKTIMDKKLDTVTAYDPVQASKLNMEIINEVLKALIKKDFDRCKLVVQASVMQNAFQSINVGLGCLWDIERDNYSYYVYQNTHIHAWCAVFGLYYDFPIRTQLSHKGCPLQSRLDEIRRNSDSKQSSLVSTSFPKPYTRIEEE